MTTILIPLPDTDSDTTEVAVPLGMLTRAGHQVVFATAAGATPAWDPLLLSGVLLGQLGAEPAPKAFDIADGGYLSARWPGDAYRLAKRPDGRGGAHRCAARIAAVVATAARHAWPLVAPLVLLSCALPKTPPAHAAYPETPTMTTPQHDYNDGEFSLSFPASWMPLPPSGDARLVVLSDGSTTPSTDENGEPVQVGVAVERYDGPFDDAVEFTALVVEGVRGDPAVETLHRLDTIGLRLCGDRRAEWSVFEFDKAGTDRRSQYQKVSLVDATGRGWIALAWVVAGRDSHLVAGDSALTVQLRGLLKTFCLEGGE